MNAATDVHSIASNREQSLVAEHYRGEIDGLRGIAVLAVLGFHAFPAYFPGGFVGVDVFFVISGFLISSIILRQLQNASFTIAGFYARRIRRIFPALLVVLTGCLLLGGVVLLATEFAELGRHVGAAAIFVSNFQLWQESGYFDTAAEFKPLLHLWSLGIEEQFYLVWPMLLLVIWRHPKSTLVSIAAIVLGSFYLSLDFGLRSPIADFYLPITRFWELGVGGLLAVMQGATGAVDRWYGREPLASPRYERFRSIAISMLPVVGVALIALAILSFNSKMPWPGWASLVPVMGAACVIVGRGETWFHRHIMASVMLVSIGLISYPLYLWHWPLLSIAAILSAGTPELAIRLAALALSFALAWLTFVVIERPIRRRRGWRICVALAIGLAVLGAAGVTVDSHDGFPGRADADIQALNPGPATNGLCPEAFGGRSHFNYCKGTQRAPPVAIFIGDSRTEAVYDSVAKVLGDRYSLMLLARGGCPPILGVDLHFIDQPSCLPVWKSGVQYIDAIKPRVVVVVGGSATLLDPSEAKLERGSAFASNEQAFKQGLRDLIAALAGTSRIIYIRELPRFPSGPSCFLRPIRFPSPHCALTISRSTAETKGVFEATLQELAQEFPQLQLVSSAASLCDATECPLKSPAGELLYRDQLHLTEAGAQYFTRSSGLIDLLERALAEPPIKTVVD